RRAAGDCRLQCPQDRARFDAARRVPGQPAGGPRRLTRAGCKAYDANSFNPYGIGTFRQMGRTLYDKIWDDHLVANNPDGTSLIYIDRHLVHEVTSPQAFEGLRMNKRKVRAPERTLAVVDHNVPTTDRSLPNPDPESPIN